MPYYTMGIDDEGNDYVKEDIKCDYCKNVIEYNESGQIENGGLWSCEKCWLNKLNLGMDCCSKCFDKIVFDKE